MRLSFLSTLQVLVFTVLSFFSQARGQIAFQWRGPTSATGSWTNGANWTPSTVSNPFPNGPGDTANFSGVDFSPPFAVALDQAVTVGRLQYFDAGFPASFSLNVSGGAAQLTFLGTGGGSTFALPNFADFFIGPVSTIEVPIVLGDSLTITTPVPVLDSNELLPIGTADFPENISGVGSLRVDARDLAVILRGANTYTGGTAVVNGYVIFVLSESLPASGSLVAQGKGAVGAQFTANQGNFLDRFDKASTTGIIAFEAFEGSLDLTGFNDAVRLGCMEVSGGGLIFDQIIPPGNAYRFASSGESALVINSELSDGLQPRSVHVTGSRDGAVNVTNPVDGGIRLNSSLNSYSGGTFVDDGMLSVEPRAVLGANTSANSVNVSPVGYLVLRSSTNVGSNQPVEIQSDASSMGMLSVLYEGVPTVTSSSSGALLLGTPTFAQAIDLLALGNGLMFLGAQNQCEITGTVSPGAGNIFRLGAGDSGPSGTNLLTVSSVLDERAAGAAVFIGDPRNRGREAVSLTAANGFTGPVTINSGELLVPSVANAGIRSPLGAGTGAITLNPLRLPSRAVDPANPLGVQFTLAGNVTSQTDRVFQLLSGGPSTECRVRVQDPGGHLILTSGLTGDGRLVKRGPGTLVLSGQGGNSGGAIVAEGTLQIDGQYGNNGGSLAVNLGASLSGSGKLLLPVTVGGSLEPGGGVGGTANVEFAQSLTLQSGSFLIMDFNGTAVGVGGATYDQVRVTGTGGVTVEPFTSLVLRLRFRPAESDVFYILTRDDQGSFGPTTFNGYPEGATVLFDNGATGFITYQANWTGNPATSSLTGGNDVAIYSVRGGVFSPFQALGTPTIDGFSTVQGSAAYAVSNDGSQVVGVGFDDALVTVGLSTDGGLAFQRVDLGAINLLPAQPDESVEAVSANGEVIVGKSGSRLRAFLRDSSGVTVLPTPPGFAPTTATGAKAVSANGLFVAGYASGTSGGPAVSPVLWSRDGTTVVLTFDTEGVAVCLSADGSVVGYNELSESRMPEPGMTLPSNKAYRWTADTGAVAFTPPGTDLSAAVFGMSANGSVAVGRSTGTAGSMSAVKWVGTTPVVLPKLSVDHQSVAYAVSADGKIVVGSYSTNGDVYKACLWIDRDEPVFLDDYLSQQFQFEQSGWSYIALTGISENGHWAVGVGTDPEGLTQGFRVRLKTRDSLPQEPVQIRYLSENSTYTLPFTTSGGLPLQYTVGSGPATVSGATVTPTGPGGVFLIGASFGSQELESDASAVWVLQLTPEAQFHPFPISTNFSPNQSGVSGISRGGAVAVGTGRSSATEAPMGFLYLTDDLDEETLGTGGLAVPTNATAISAFSDTIVGSFSVGNTRTAARFDLDTLAIEPLAAFEGIGINTEAQAISADGSTIVGTRVQVIGSTPLNAEAGFFANGRFQPYASVLPTTPLRADATAVSSDGGVVVGIASDATRTVGVVWSTPTGGTTILEPPLSQTGESAVNAVSADGRSIVGFGDTTPLERLGAIWKLDKNYSLAGLQILNDLPGSSEFASANAVSGDSFVVGGFGTRGSSLTETARFSSANPGAGSRVSRGPVVGRDGNLYGVTVAGGTADGGVLFRVSPNGGAPVVVFNFTAATGTAPQEMVVGPDGALYGACNTGGPNGAGTLFRYDPSESRFSVIYAFDGATAGSPLRAPTISKQTGNLIGVTTAGGANNVGVVYEIATNGTLVVTAPFSAATGTLASGGLVEAEDGNFWGVARRGGANDAGTIFRYSPSPPSPAVTLVYSFDSATSGFEPVDKLTLGPDGALYGATFGGGANNRGTIFRVLTTGDFTSLYSFGAPTAPGLPRGGLVYGGDGFLYGTVSYGGAFYGDTSIVSSVTVGGIFRIALDGSEFSLVQAFSPQSGVLSFAAPVRGGDGALYGPLFENPLGTDPGNNRGAIYRFVPEGRQAVVWRAPSYGPQALQELAVATNPSLFAALAGWNLSDITAMSDDGNVVAGSGTDPEGRSRLWKMVLPKRSVFQFVPQAVGFFESDTAATVRLEKSSGLPASVTVSTGQAGMTNNATPGLDFTARTGTVFNFGSAPGAVDIPVGILDDAQVEPTETFGIFANDGAAVSSVFISIVDNDVASPTPPEVAAPGNAPSNLSSLELNLPAGAQWRLLGETEWRDGGSRATGLQPGDYVVEFRPLNGVAPVSITVTLDGTGLLSRTVSYPPSAGTAQTGSLAIRLRPLSVTTGPNRAQWRRVGDTVWNDADAELPGCDAGLAIIEFKPVSGRATPANISVVVTANAVARATVTYLPATVADAARLPLELQAADVSQDPYRFVGQLRHDLGFGTGFAVQERVVLTDAHVVFDDATLSFVPGVRWYHQRMKGEIEPPPLPARGFIVFSTYASQRSAELEPNGPIEPGFGSRVSQNKDVAALFFQSTVARNGFAGLLEITPSFDPLLQSGRSKVLVGYPGEAVGPITPDKFGRMYSSGLNRTPAPRFAHVYSASEPVYATDDLLGVAGMSGGPLCVKLDDNQFYPAALFLGGSDEAIVRGIDADIVAMVALADNTSRGMPAATPDARFSEVAAVDSAASVTFGRLRVLTTDDGVDVGGWRLRGETDFRGSGEEVSLVSGRYQVEFMPDPQFVTPATQSVEIDTGTVVSVIGEYNRRGEPTLAAGATLPDALVGVPYRYRIPVSARNADLSIEFTPLDPSTLLPDTSGLYRPTDPALFISDQDLLGIPSRAGLYRARITIQTDANQTVVTQLLRVLTGVNLAVDFDSARGTVAINTPQVAGERNPRRFFTPLTDDVAVTLHPNKRYLLNAVPRPGAVFAGWRSVVNGTAGDLLSSASQLTFTPSANATLQALFIANPFPALRGTICGLSTGARPDGQTADEFIANSGMVSIDVIATGMFTGRVQVGNTVVPLVGRFNGAGEYSTIIRRRRPLPDIAIVFRLNTSTGDMAATTTIGTAVHRADCKLAAAATSPLLASARGTYNLALLPTLDSDGVGFGVLTLDAAARVRGSLILADRSVATVASKMNRSGDLPLFQITTRGRGIVFGNASLTGGPAARPLTGTLAWRKAAVATEPVYPTGITATLTASGAKYQRPPLPFTTADFVAGSGVFTQPLTIPLTVNATRATFTPANPTPGFKLTYVSANGMFMGTFQQPEVTPTKTLSFMGLFESGANRGLGFFVLPEKVAARVTLQPTP